MQQDYVFAPHMDFFIELRHRDEIYEMNSFHFHKRYELYYLLEGARRYFIGDANYLVNAGTLVLICADEIHRTGAVGESGHTRIVMNFSDDWLQNDLPGVDLSACFHSGVHIIVPPMRMRGLIESILMRMYEEREDQTPEAIALRKTLLTELMIYIGRLIAEQGNKEPADARAHNDTIDEIQRYISSHYAEDLSLSSIAAQFYLSTSYLSRLFKRVTSLSIIDYINSVRMMAAKNLLETSSLKIAEVSLQAGFSTTVHFTRVFKAGTGMSPQQYRKRYKQSTEPPNRRQ